MEHTAQSIAAWMIDTIKAEDGMEHYWVVGEIPVKFGSEWDYANLNGNPAVDPRILREFKKQHAGTIEWDNDGKRWTPTE